MRVDQVVGLCKKALNQKDLFIPEQVASVMSEVVNMNAAVYKEEEFNQWEPLLRKYFTTLPKGFTQYYHFEFTDGKVQYKHLTTTADQQGLQHNFVTNLQATKKAVLQELLNLPANATLMDIVTSKLVLPYGTPPKLSDSKAKSIANKIPYIPEEYRGYYLGFDQFMASEPAHPQVDKEASKKRLGRPRQSSSNSSGVTYLAMSRCFGLGDRY